MSAYLAAHGLRKAVQSEYGYDGNSNSRFKGSLSMIIPPDRGNEKVFEVLISLSYGSSFKDRALGREFFV